MGVALMSVALMSVALMGMLLIGVALMGVHVMGDQSPILAKTGIAAERVKRTCEMH